MEWVAAALLCGVGVLALTKSTAALLLRRRMRRWPRVEGNVRKGWIHVSGGRNRTYRAVFEVALRHGGQELIARCDSPTRAGYGDSRGAEDELRQHPPESRVMVYVNPDEPTTCYLTLPEPHVIGFLLMGGVVLIAAAGAAIVAAISPRHQETAVLLFFVTAAVGLAGAAVTAFLMLMKKGLVRRSDA